MNRDLIYPGQIALVENILDAFKAAMIGIAATSEAVLGQSTLVSGLAATALSNTAVIGSPFAINIGRGFIFAFEETDPNAYGVLGTDTATSILKTGINLSPTPIGIAASAPATAGQSINYLVSAAFQEQDTNQESLPFYNGGATPTITVQNGTRAQTVVFQVTAGAAATTGSQTTPSTPAGSVPLTVVTVTNGQSAVAAGNISVAPSAPLIDPLNLGRGISNGRRLIGARYFSSSTIYVPTLGTNWIEVELIGGGGSGGATAATGASQIAAGPGGGSGGIARVTLTSGFSNVPITVGAGGAAPAAGAAGNAGGTTSFGSFAVATGGKGGTLGVATAVNSLPEGGGPAGLGTIGDFIGSGCVGVYALYTNPANSGAGGASPYGGGGTGYTGASNGASAVSYGAGGGGGVQSTASSPGALGGAGGSGLVIVREYS